jgi:hypothetical protein
MGEHDWIEEAPVAVTVTDAAGVIIAMNGCSRARYAAEGGVALIGTDVLACHPEPARTTTAAMYAAATANHYVVVRAGRRTAVHQVPWYRDGVFAGFVELQVPLPGELPEVTRG